MLHRLVGMGRRVDDFFRGFGLDDMYVHQVFDLLSFGIDRSIMRYNDSCH